MSGIIRNMEEERKEMIIFEKMKQPSLPLVYRFGLGKTIFFALFSINN